MNNKVLKYLTTSLPKTAGMLLFKKATNLLFLFCYLPIFALSQAGTLDNTFGSNGIVTYTIHPQSNDGRDFIIRPDGRIVVVGSTYDGGILLGHNPDGSFDNSFGINGIVTNTNSLPSNAIVQQPDGKFIIVGVLFVGIGNYDFLIQRYLPNGNVDSNFGVNGSVTTSISTSNGDDNARKIVLQPDGKIIVGGESAFSGNNSLTLVRYNQDGSLDNSFGTNGIITTTIGVDNSSSPGFTDIKLLQDGKMIVACSYSNGVSNNTFSSALLRYNTNGSLDNSFGINGIATNSNVSGAALELTSDGKYLLAGNTYSISKSIVVKYNTDGSIDATFGSNGYAFTPSVSTMAMCIQQDNKIIVGGRNGSLGTGSLVLIRYNSDGSSDNTFGNNGVTMTDINVGYDLPRSISMQADGKILVVGNSGDPPNTRSFFLLARYLSGLVIGLNENSNSNKETFIYPNPTTGKLFIEAKEVNKITISNYLGQTIFTLDNSTAKKEIDLSPFASGIYFLNVQSKAQQEVFKIIKE